MKKYIFTELKRALFNRYTFASMLIALVCLIIPYKPEQLFREANSDGINFFIRIEAYLPTSYLPLLAPLIACIPFSNSYLDDKESGILNYIFLRIERKKYYLIRVVVNALVSGLVFLISEVSILLYSIHQYGINNNTTQVVGAFSNVYYSSKIGYCILLIISCFVYGMVISTLALGASALTENKFLTILLPFIYVIITGTIFEILPINSIVNLNAAILFDISYYSKLTSIHLIVYDAVLFFIGSFLFYRFGVRKDYE